MPLYEYTCKSCKKRFEKLVKSINASEEVACPDCGSTRTSRTISVFAAVGAQTRGKSSNDAPGMCGRCGGPGPCALD